MNDTVNKLSIQNKFRRKIYNLHVELTTNCQLRCPQCARFNGDEDNPFLNHSELTLEKFKELLPPEDILSLGKIFFCGNYGDPVIAKDFVPIISYVRTISTEVTIEVYTNGSLRNSRWWEDLAAILGSNSLTYFAVDGMKDTHSIYRRGSNFFKLVSNIRSYSKSGGRFAIASLQFQYNKDQEKEIIDLSRSLGAEFITFKRTNRSVHEDHKDFLKLIPIEESKNKDISKTKVRCSYLKDEMLYLGADGVFYPCCFIPTAMTSRDKVMRDEVLNKSNKELNEMPFNPTLEICKAVCSVNNNDLRSKTQRQFVNRIYFKE